MSRADEREPEPLPEHARALLAVHRYARAMPQDAFAHVRRALHENAVRPWWTGPLAIGLAVAVVLVLVLGLRGRQRAQRIDDGDAATLAPDRVVPPQPGIAGSAAPPAALPPAMLPPAPQPTELALPQPGPRSRPTRHVDAAPPELLPAPSPGSLAAERELLARAWAALTEGAPQRALQVVAEHRDRFADGALVPERDAIAAIARCRTAAIGRAAQGEAFARIHHDSPLLERVRSACAEE